MDSAYLSAVAALAGTAVGGLTSFFGSWLGQSAQFKAQIFLQEKGRRPSCTATSLMKRHDCGSMPSPTISRGPVQDDRPLRSDQPDAHPIAPILISFSFRLVSDHQDHWPNGLCFTGGPRPR